MIRALVLLIVLGSALIVLAGVAAMSDRAPRERTAAAIVCTAAYAVILWTRPESLVWGNVAVLAVAIALAPLLGRSLGSFGAIVAFAITVSIVDLLSFGGGLTRRIIQNYQAGTDDLLRFLAVTVPIGGRPRPLAGVVDLMIMGSLFLGLVRIHGNRPRAAVFLLAALAVAVIVGMTIGGVAGLPFLAAAAAGDAWLARDRDTPD
jgi:hypothetical protein